MGIIMSVRVLILLYTFLVVAAASEREALEIMTGGGGGYVYGSPPPPSPSPSGCSPLPPPPPPPRCPPTMTRLQKARSVLLKFASSINDTSGYTKNWKEAKNPCKFNGVRCAKYPNTSELAVAGLNLNGASISGLNRKNVSLSGILNKLQELTFFHVNSNNFAGPIPNEIIRYPYFFELDLSNNKLEGQFPMQVLQSKQLVFLDLRFNNLYGPIPPQLFLLDLDVIFINNNDFSGYLPDNFGSTPARFLSFANNKLAGPIPQSIGNASKTLTEVLFLGNNIEGCLPYEIGYLKMATVFDVSKNCLTGPIPLSFACLEKIQFLNLEHNQFYGTVPEMVCELPGLRNGGNLSLSNNYFTQVGPECRKLIEAKVLDVSNNCILGLPNQKPYEQCSEFFSKVKPCPNPKYLSYIPCKGYFSRSTTHTTAAPAPVTYNTLKPHRL
ncbi:uncharacterized protein At4g06744 [Gastrolobium bilobum]|uniref:uncharacterized protein At4g06744 n=1 Tax=Gastrolobium bilobum TaxID=150636 RepID=UPI002AB107A8|nr:uncharacterized protein At4g06744 [Gastrolobium bilobum]